MTEPNLGSWSDEQVCEFDIENDQNRISAQTSEALNNPETNEKKNKKRTDLFTNKSDDKELEDEDASSR